MLASLPASPSDIPASPCLPGSLADEGELITPGATNARILPFAGLLDQATFPLLPLPPAQAPALKEIPAESPPATRGDFASPPAPAGTDARREQILIPASPAFSAHQFVAPATPDAPTTHGTPAPVAAVAATSTSNTSTNTATPAPSPALVRPDAPPPSAGNPPATPAPALTSAPTPAPAAAAASHVAAPSAAAPRHQSRRAKLETPELRLLAQHAPTQTSPLDALTADSVPVATTGPLPHAHNAGAPVAPPVTNAIPLPAPAFIPPPASATATAGRELPASNTADLASTPGPVSGPAPRNTRATPPAFTYTSTTSTPASVTTFAATFSSSDPAASSFTAHVTPTATTTPTAPVPATVTTTSTTGAPTVRDTVTPRTPATPCPLPHPVAQLPAQFSSPSPEPRTNDYNIDSRYIKNTKYLNDIKSFANSQKSLGTEQAKPSFDMAPSAPFTAPAPATAPIAAGLAAPASDSRPPVTGSSESSEAVLLVQKVTALADRLLARPTEQVSIRIDLGDTSHVDVRIALEAGKVRADFQTNSPALRTALAEAWQDFARQSPGTEQRWSEPTFTSPGNQPASTPAFASSPVSSPAAADATSAFNTDQGSARREPPARFLDPTPAPSSSRSPAPSRVNGAPLQTTPSRSDTSHHLDLFA